MDPWTTLDRSSRSSRRHAKMPTRPTCRHENSTHRRAKSPNGQVADSEVKPLKSFIVEVCLVCSTTRRPSSSASSLFASATWYVGDVHEATSARATWADSGCSEKHFAPRSRDDNGSAGDGSRVKWVNKSEWVTWVSTRDPLTNDFVFSDIVELITAQLKPQRQFNSVVSTEYFDDV